MRINADRLVEVYHRSVEVLASNVAGRAIGEPHEALRSQSYRLVEVGNCPVVLAQHRARDGSVTVGVGVLGIGLDAFGEVLDSGIETNDIRLVDPALGGVLAKAEAIALLLDDAIDDQIKERSAFAGAVGGVQVKVPPGNEHGLAGPGPLGVLGQWGC